MNEGQGGQYSMYQGPKHKCFLPESVANALAPEVIQSNAAIQYTSGVGVQNVFLPLGMNGPGIATTYTGDNISRVVYEKCSADVTINNALLSNCYIIIYDIVSRKDVGINTINSPLLAWTQGDIDTGATPAYTYLGSQPFQSECFNQFYEVCQTTRVVLGAGQTHVHQVRTNDNRLISGAYAAYTKCIAGLSRFVMLEMHGSPANDTTTQTQVSIGKAVINVIVDVEHTLKQIQKQTPSITTNNTLPASFTVGEQVVNIGGSIIAPNAEG